MVAGTAGLTAMEVSAAERLAARSHLPEEGAAMVREVARIFGVGEDCIYSESRLARLVDARTVIAMALRRRAWTFEEIGRLLNRNYSTIQHLVERGERMDDLRPLARELVTA